MSGYVLMGTRWPCHRVIIKRLLLKKRRHGAFFINDYKDSIHWVNSNSDRAAKLLKNHDISIPAEVADKVIVRSNILYVDDLAAKQAACLVLLFIILMSIKFVTLGLSIRIPLPNSFIVPLGVLGFIIGIVSFVDRYFLTMLSIFIGLIVVLWIAAEIIVSSLRASRHDSLFVMGALYPSKT